MQAKDLRQGATIVVKGDIQIVTDFRHYTPGNKRGFVQATIQSLRTGKIVQNRFSSTEEIQEANLDSKRCQFLYRDQEGHHFMDLAEFHSFPISDTLIGEKKYYLKENDEMDVDFYEGQPVRVVIPNHVYLKLTESPPWVKAS